MSAKGAHVQGASGSESTNSPVSSSPHSPIIDAKYVFISEYNYYLRYYMVDSYCHIYYFYEIKFCVTCDINPINRFIYFTLGMNQDESYFVTFSHDNTTN